MASDLALANPERSLLLRLFQANQNIEAADKALKRAKENKKAALMVRERLDSDIAAYAQGDDPELELNVTKSAKPAKSKSKKKPAKNRPVKALNK